MAARPRHGAGKTWTNHLLRRRQEAEETRPHCELNHHAAKASTVIWFSPAAAPKPSAIRPCAVIHDAEDGR